MRKISSSMKGQSIRSDYPLTNEEIMAVAPSVFATEPYHDRSIKYVLTPTIDSIEALRDEGFFPFFAAQSGSRIEDKRGHTKHMLRFRKASNITVQESVHEIVMLNDSAGGGSHLIVAGEFVYACMNGNVFGDVSSEFRVRHQGNAADNVIEGVYSVLSTFDKVDESMDLMKSLTLSRDEQMVFAEAALQLRYDKLAKAPIQPYQLLQPVRREDLSPSLWNTFQMSQEKLTRGGLRGVTTNDQGKRKRTTTRAVNGITENVKLNRALWTLADQMAAIKAGSKLERDALAA